jgi:hypothetical protein
MSAGVVWSSSPWPLLEGEGADADGAASLPTTISPLTWSSARKAGDHGSFEIVTAVLFAERHAFVADQGGRRFAKSSGVSVSMAGT